MLRTYVLRASPLAHEVDPLAVVYDCLLRTGRLVSLRERQNGTRLKVVSARLEALA
jgi:hypothetical protein